MSWLRKKLPVSAEASLAEALLKLPDDRFAAIVKEMLEREPPDAHAMMVVAYKNLIQTLAVFKSESHTLGKPFDIAEVLHFEAEFRSPAVPAEDRGEVIRRRYAWFLVALAVHHLTEKAESNPTLVSTTADVWVMMAKSGWYLQALLPNNIVWRADEKEWFSLLKNEADGIHYVANHVVPKKYRKDARLVALADKHNFWLDPPDLSDAAVKTIFGSPPSD